MLSKILVPLDVAEFNTSVGIVPYVSRIASGLNAPVVFITVLDPEHLEDYQAVYGEPAEEPSLEDAKTEVRRWLNQFMARLGDDGIDAQCEVLVGSNPTEEILRVAREQGCDLIAMATHDRNLLAKTLKGSVTNDVIRSSPVPVLAISPQDGEIVPGQRVELSQLLAPLDGSEFAETVLPYVEDLARRMSLKVHLVRSLSPGTVYPAPAGVVPPSGAVAGQAIADVYNLAEEDIINYLTETSKRLSSKGLDVSWEMLRGATGLSISDLAQSISNSMIVIASHGRSGVRRWVLGSVAEDLISNSGDPVLVVPPSVAEADEQS